MFQLPVSLSKLSLISLVTSYTSIIALPPYFLIIATTLAAHSTHTITTFNALSTSILYLLICCLFFGGRLQYVLFFCDSQYNTYCSLCQYFFEIFLFYLVFYLVFYLFLCYIEFSKTCSL